jgi:hypothetical protein
MVSPFMSHTATSPLLVLRQNTLVDAVEVLFAVWVLGSIWLFDVVDVVGVVPPEMLAEELPTFIV